MRRRRERRPRAPAGRRPWRSRRCAARADGRSRRVKRSSRSTPSRDLDGPPSPTSRSRRWRIRAGERGGREEALAGGRPAGRHRGLVGVEHRNVAAALVEEDPLLRREVAGEVAVPVEMVGRDVEQRRRARAEALDRLELEARQLDDEDPSGRPVDDRRQRPPDVAADLDREAGAGEQSARSSPWSSTCRCCR